MRRSLRLGVRRGALGEDQRMRGSKIRGEHGHASDGITSLAIRKAKNIIRPTCLRPDATTRPVEGLERDRFEGLELQGEGV